MQQQPHPLFHAFLLFSLSLVVLLYKCLYSKRKNLPPGSRGLPFIGETHKIYSENPNSFFKQKCSKYGTIFETNVLGYPSVMVSNPESVKNILVTDAHLFKPSYPKTKEALIGPEAIFFQQGDLHTKLKKLVQTFLRPSSIRHFVSDIETLVLDILSTWENRTVTTLNEMKTYTFNVVMLTLFGTELDSERELIRHLFECLDKGYNSMESNFPNSQYSKSLKARRKLNKTLRRIVEMRRQTDQEGGGLLEEFLSSGNDGNNRLTDSQIVDNIVGVIFAARDTTASILTWILKYLYDDANVLSTVRREQEEIRAQTIEENRMLKWEDTRNMPYTSRVIQETIRAASITSFTFREAVEDVKFEGYDIPKGWKVLPLFRSIHHSEEFFPEPEKFDPSRFEVPPKPNTYMPFGSGAHACPGNELAKLEMLILIHHLTTTYRWEVVGNNEGIQYAPFLVPKNGLPVRAIKMNNTRV